MLGYDLPEEARNVLGEHFEVLGPFETEEDRIEAMRDAVGHLGGRISKELLQAAPSLRAISTPSAGYDHLDLEDITRRGIVVMNSSAPLAETTADLAFALILATARRVAELDALVRSGHWTGNEHREHNGVDVHGKVLGIIGLGHIGSGVARRGALGFDMRVLYYSPRHRPDVEASTGAKKVDLDELLITSDFVCVTAPLGSETRGLIGRRELHIMKPTAIIVNIARGAIVVEDELAEALRTGVIRGAGLDVFVHEPLPPSSPFMSLPNTVLLPHIGSASDETRSQTAVYAAENLVQYLVFGAPRNVVNPAALEAHLGR